MASKKQYVTIDGNTAAAHVAYALSEVAALYPITPATPMGELVDEWASKERKNIFGKIVQVMEMQSEGGAAGVVHGSLTAGALTTTFTASQGLLLMLPNMFKIAGELLPAVFHIAARSLAYQSLSIFGDHSDIMAARGTGFGMLASNNVQEAMDMALVAHLSTLESRIPFLHFFDGFRTSHEIQKVETLSYEEIKSMVDEKQIDYFKQEAIRPDKPYAKVGAENPDVYFQGREVANCYYQATPAIVQKYMALVAKKTGRKYNLFEYVGAKDAKKIIVAMGSACETIEETVAYLNKKGSKVGVLKVRLYRPFSVKDCVAAIPKSVKKIAVLDRTKESGSVGEPLYLDIVSALQGRNIKIIGGRYGLGSKEFTPSYVKAVFDHVDGKCFHNFTVGIEDDITKTSLPIKEEVHILGNDVVQCKFWGFGSDGTVGANKNTIKIIGENTPLFVQGYFSYDSRKSGGTTVSHVRFGKTKIKAPYLLEKSDFIALHNHAFVGKYGILEGIKERGTFLINTPWQKENVFENLTRDMQEIIIKKKINVYTIDAYKIAREVGLGNRINTVMQAAFFKIANILPEKKAMQLIKDSIQKTFEKKGKDVVAMNFKAVDKTLAALQKVAVPTTITQSAPEKDIARSDLVFASEVISPIIKLKGDTLPVSKMSMDGKVPTGTTRLEKRGIASEVPHWFSEKCIQCGLCSFVCPHAAIRIKQIELKSLDNAPKTFRSVKSNTKNDRNLQFAVQVYPEDCTGCTLCVNACPVKEKAILMSPIEKERSQGENNNASFFDALPDNILDGIPPNTIKGTQLKTPLFEFSGACAGCGETPYIKLLTQLFGDRLVIANATGCSSIFGGTFPTIPYAVNKEGKGPAWANSLFEDNAEYGLGMRLAVDANRESLKMLINEFLLLKTDSKLQTLFEDILSLWESKEDKAVHIAREIKDLLTSVMQKSKGKTKEILLKIRKLQDYLTYKSVWAVGGDGWAYDIGFGGLDHVLASGKNIKVLVLDTEVYSNTGGQSSKATPMGAVAKFASAGKEMNKKNLGMMMMNYGNIYVASVNMGADRNQLIKAFMEAENYDGPAIIIAYSTCISHGINMSKGQEREKKSVDSGYWPLFRFNPALSKEAKNPFSWDSPEKSISFQDYILEEKRYTILQNQFPERAKKLFGKAEEASKERSEGLKRKGE